MITHLYNIAKVSRYGYYKYFSVESKNKRDKNNIIDEILRDNILKAFNFKNKKRPLDRLKFYFKMNSILTTI